MNREPFFTRLVHSVIMTVSTLAVVLALIAGGVWLATNKDKKPADGSWLVLDLYGEVHEYDPPGGPLATVMGGDALTLQDLLDNLGKAAVDERIAGVIFRISSSNDTGFAKLQELRRAVDKVQAAGKPVHAWADALDLRSLWLAAGCDQVLMPTGGYLTFKGVHVQRMYLRAMLDKLGVVPHLHKIKDYKAAAEMIMQTHASTEAKQNMQWIMDEVWATIMADLSRERGLDEARLLEHMAYAVFTPTEAVAAGLIDECVYLQDLEDRLKGDKDERLRTVGHEQYAKTSWKDAGLKTGPTVAVVHAQGNIGGRENRVDPLLGVMMGHESIVRELQRCRHDDKVEAVVLRIDSGGGESLASDLMAHEVDLLAAVKPVVISMVDVAASGGYYIAYKGTKLMASPLTITGSIGSINGLFNLKGLYDRIGVDKDGIAMGPMAEYGTDMRDPTDAEWARHTEAHWLSFNEWLADVAKERGLEFAAAESLAHGRTWTGTQAVANGLIDAVGNLDDAIALAAELAELDPAKVPTVVHLPREKGLVASLLGGDAGADDPVAAAVRSALYRGLRAQVRETGAFLRDGAANVVTP
ncbi:MAG: S49 family peptidase [Krumholzibacteria bacterium]|nr:S49 family peptidase [Candidatus Krumholzibacteria bacterium]